MSLDSVPVFKKRLEFLGIGDLQEQFKTLGWQTLGDFAFCVNYSPGPVEDATFEARVVKPLTGVDNSPRASVIRRLYFEAFSAAAKDVSRRVETGGDEVSSDLQAQTQCFLFRSHEEYHIYFFSSCGTTPFFFPNHG